MPFVARLMWDNALTIEAYGPDGSPRRIQVRLQDGQNRVGVVVTALADVTFDVVAVSPRPRPAECRLAPTPRPELEERRGRAMSHRGPAHKPC